MSQSSIFNKLSRVLQALKFPIVLAIVAGAVWYVRSQPIPVTSHAFAKGVVVHSVMGSHDHGTRTSSRCSTNMEDGIIRVSTQPTNH